MAQRPELTRRERVHCIYKKYSFTGIVVSLVAGNLFCNNPFATRDPEPPSGEQTSWVQPIAPEIVLTNLQSAIREKSVENYIRCFGLSDDVRRGFTFKPEISVANNYRGVFLNWSIDEERNYINNLFSFIPSDSLSVLFLTDVTEIQFGDSVITSKEYDLIVAHSNSSAPGSVSGRMELSLKKGSDALWFISRWADFKTSELPVWSLLKAQFK